MKFYFKQKLFKENEDFYITNEANNNCFMVKSNLRDYGGDFFLCDLYGNELAKIDERMITRFFTTPDPKCYIYINGIKRAKIIKKVTIASHKYRIEGVNLEIDMSIHAHDCKILCNGNIVGLFHKKWFSTGKSYEIIINDNQDVILILSIILALILEEKYSSIYASQYDFGGG